ncbi:MAG: MBL fold metallo-hydrolase [bacterium]|jgi:glyoxylase-like metal-dependent hydrolase (beta-lactamase superfamily II)
MLKTVKLTPQVTEIQVPSNETLFRAFAVETAVGTVIVDAGVEATASEFVETIKPLRPIMLVITHRHGDHTAGLPKVTAELPDLPVAAHAEEAEALPVPAQRQLQDGEEIVPGLEVVHVPGHSAGNIALLLKGEGTLIAGDCVFGAGAYTERLAPPPARFCADVATAERNVALLLNHDFDKAVLSHGEHLLADAKEQIAALVK